MANGHKFHIRMPIRGHIEADPHLPEEVGHGHVTGEFIWRFTILKCVLGSLYEYLNLTSFKSSIGE